MRRWLTVFGVCLAASFAVGPGASAQQRGAEMIPVAPDGANSQARPELVKLYSHSFALVIGIDAYRDRAWPRLSNAVRDAKAVAEALDKHGFKVTLKTDLAAAELEASLRDFFIKVGAEQDARLLLWFAGHGHTVNDEGYLVPADAPSPSTGATFRFAALSLRRFSEYMREAQSRHVMAIFDSCFGGTVFETARAHPSDTITRATTQPVRQMISSGEAEQKVSDDGTFRKLFVDALNGEEPLADANRDGFITGTELGLFLSDKVVKLRRGSQVPRYGKLNAIGYDRGDFVFRVGGTAKQAAAPPPVAPPPTQPRLSEAAEAWDRAERVASVPALEAFIRRFGDTYYGDLAKVRLAELKQAEATEAAKKADADARAKADAERQRLAFLQQEQERKRAEAEEARKRAEATEGMKPGRVLRDCSDCPEMVVVPAGSFTMGSPASEPERLGTEGPQLKVTISRAFAVGKFSVTFDEWDACVAGGGCNGYRPADQGWGRGKRPVINVNWNDAKAYVAWLARKTGKSYRLLSEVEREYVTRAGTTTPFWWGSSISTNQANYYGDATYGGGSKGESRQKTVPVDSFAANPWGLYNVHGNVWEWVEDCWHDSYQGAPTDGSAWMTSCTESGHRVIRGGSWNNYPQNLRSANRSRYASGGRGSNFGFRVGRTLMP